MDCSHAIKGLLILGRKPVTNLDSVLRSRDITFLKKFHLVKAMVFPVVMYRRKSWTIVWNPSASVLLMNSQDWFPLGLTDLIFLQSKGLSNVFKSLLQHHSSKALILQCSTFFMVPLVPPPTCHLPSPHPTPYTLHSTSCPTDSDGKESACSVRDLVWIPGWGRSPGEGNDYPLQYSCLENPMDRGLVGYSPWGHKESDRTEQLILSLSLPPFVISMMNHAGIILNKKCETEKNTVWSICRIQIIWTCRKRI